MKATVAVTASFGASHVSPLTCTYEDGHLWIVTMYLEGELLGGTLTDAKTLRGALVELVEELDGKRLNDMAPGIVPSPEGLATYLHERFRFTQLVRRVAVEMQPGYRAEVEWPRR